MSKETAKYINRIKNQGKHDYATQLYLWIRHSENKHPDYKEFGISVMAAQAVEMNLGKLEGYYQVVNQEVVQ